MLRQLENTLTLSRAGSQAKTFWRLGWIGFWTQIGFGSLPVILVLRHSCWRTDPCAARHTQIDSTRPSEQVGKCAWVRELLPRNLAWADQADIEIMSSTAATFFSISLLPFACPSLAETRRGTPAL